MEKLKGSHKVSVLQGTEKKCFITGRIDNLHKHHIFFGVGKRAISDKHGFWVWLTGEMHNQSAKGVHGKYGHELDIYLKTECQKAYEEQYSHEDFMRLIGRNYIGVIE